MKYCYKCGKELETIEPVSRGDLCPECGAFVRCCLNCSFHDEGYHNQCREPQSELIPDKEAANFCDWFKLADREMRGEFSSSRGDARRKFDELFKK